MVAPPKPKPMPEGPYVRKVESGPWKGAAHSNEIDRGELRIRNNVAVEGDQGFIGKYFVDEYGEKTNFRIYANISPRKGALKPNMTRKEILEARGFNRSVRGRSIEGLDEQALKIERALGRDKKEFVYKAGGDQAGSKKMQQFSQQAYGDQAGKVAAEKIFNEASDMPKMYRGLPRRDYLRDGMDGKFHGKGYSGHGQYFSTKASANVSYLSEDMNTWIKAMRSSKEGGKPWIFQARLEKNTAIMHFDEIYALHKEYLNGYAHEITALRSKMRVATTVKDRVAAKTAIKKLEDLQGFDKEIGRFAARLGVDVIEHESTYTNGWDYVVLNKSKILHNLDSLPGGARAAEFEGVLLEAVQAFKGY